MTELKGKELVTVLNTIPAVIKEYIDHTEQDRKLAVAGALITAVCQAVEKEDLTDVEVFHGIFAIAAGLSAHSSSGMLTAEHLDELFEIFVDYAECFMHSANKGKQQTHLQSGSVN